MAWDSASVCLVRYGPARASNGPRAQQCGFRRRVWYSFDGCICPIIAVLSMGIYIRTRGRKIAILIGKWRAEIV